MANATLARVLNDIRTLDPEELRSVERAIQEQWEAAAFGYSPGEWRALRSLQTSGQLKEIKPRRTERTEEPPPVRITGKPLSETIIEERR